SSQCACSAQNRSNSDRMARFGEELKLAHACSSKRCLKAMTASKSTASLGRKRPALQSSPLSNPSSIRRSGLTRSALPANEDKLWYGELPYPVGPSGSACHQL